ncbi:MAG: uncharacterized membrane-anchored protein YitT (DUF2179 family) [Motiliproteus sp.]|jgi:uncharacterized membrane-anchored protein YitT (DUF2179 family)
MNSSAAMTPTHSYLEDLFALLTGTTFVALGVFLFAQQGLLTGGTAGLALLLTHTTGLSFGQIFFAINLPFYWLAWKQMGWRFCLNTFISVLTVSFFVDYADRVIEVSRINTLFAALLGGFLMGMGMLVLFRHRSSLGGVGILALFLQARYGIRAGKFQMAIDCLILMCSFFVVSWELLLFSVLGAGALNLVITMNHKPGRYHIT